LFFRYIVYKEELMTLRLGFIGNALPADFMVDQSAEFEAGQVAQLMPNGNQITVTVSNGTAPLGIIDGVRTRSFTNISWNEEIIVPATGVISDGYLVTPIDIKAELKRPNIVPGSFTSTVDVFLNPVNGVVTFLAGTPLNIDLTGQGSSNGIRAIVNYTYQVANIPGDDSTMGSNKVTVWFQRMICQTDKYETNQQYPVNANLFVSETGLFTTRRPSENHPAVALVLAPPSTLSPMIELLWL
jgi:hypothetical protein